MTPESWRARRSIAAALAIVLGLVAWIVVSLRQRPTQAVQGEPSADPGVPSYEETVGAALTPPTGADTGRASLDRTTRIEIVDERGTWLDAVEVSVHRAEEVVRLGHSREGVVSARLPSSGTLVATCAGYLDGIRTLTDEVPEAIRLVLAELPSVRGRLVLPDGAPAGAGLRVVAWRDGTERARLRQALTGSLEEFPPELAALQTESDAQGRFALCVPAGDSIYFLTAGGRGLLPLDVLRQVRPGPEPVVLVLHPAFAARVRFVDEAGGELRVSDDLWLRPGAVEMRCQDPVSKPRYLAPGSIESQLAGIDPTWFEGGNAWRSASILCTTDADVGAIGPFEVGVRLPGYQPATTECVALALAAGLATTELALARSAQGWGDLELEITGSSSDEEPLAATHTALPAALVQMRAEDGSVLRLGISSLSVARERFSEIPWGSYRVSIQLAHHLGRARLGEDHEVVVEIGAEPSVLAADISELGSLEMEIVDGEGQPWAGAVQATVETEAGRGSDPTQFEGPPYRFDGLDPGRYRVRLLLPFRRFPSPGDADPAAVVEAGRVTPVRLTPP